MLTQKLCSTYISSDSKTLILLDLVGFVYSGGGGGSTSIPQENNVLLRLQLHGAIYRPDSFVLMLRYCANLKAIRYESTNLNRIVADKSHRVIVATLLCELQSDKI